MSLVISDEVVRATRMSEDEHREIAVLLYAQDSLTLGQASKLAGMGQLEFQRVAASRGICVHYDVEEFRRALKTLDDLHIL